MTVAQERFILPSTEAQHKDLIVFLTKSRKTLKRLLNKFLRKYENLKCNITLQIKLIKFDHDRNESIFCQPYFTSKVQILHSEFEISSTIDKAYADVQTNYLDFQSQGSGWRIFSIMKMIVSLNKIIPMRGGKVKCKIMDKVLLAKKAVLNIPCINDKCFVNAIIISVFPHLRKSSPNRYPEFEKYFNLSKIKYPVSVNDVKKFENQNKAISINLFAYQQGKVRPLLITKYKNRKTHVQLLLVNNHFYLLRSLSKLLYKDNHNHTYYYCNYCLISFQNNSKLVQHLKLCKKGPSAHSNASNK